MFGYDSMSKSLNYDCEQQIEKSKTAYFLGCLDTISRSLKSMIGSGIDEDQAYLDGATMLDDVVDVVGSEWLGKNLIGSESGSISPLAEIISGYNFDIDRKSCKYEADICCTCQQGANMTSGRLSIKVIDFNHRTATTYSVHSAPFGRRAYKIERIDG